MDNFTTTDHTTLHHTVKQALSESELFEHLCPEAMQQAGLCTEVADVVKWETGSTEREQELAILFLDIRNFTGLLEAQPAKEVIQVVRRLFSVFNRIIKGFKGRVVEMAGDSLYAVFGLSSSIKDAVNEGYQATKMMFEALNLFNHHYAQPYYGAPIEIGVGFHAGNVLVGQFSLEGPEQLSVMGLPVNFASRLQAKTKEMNNDIIISDKAYQYLDDVEDTERLLISLQGISGRQAVRLVGKPYERALANPYKDDFQYLLAISG